MSARNLWHKMVGIFGWVSVREVGDFERSRPEVIPYPSAALVGWRIEPGSAASLQAGFRQLGIPFPGFVTWLRDPRLTVDSIHPI